MTFSGCEALWVDPSANVTQAYASVILGVNSIGNVAFNLWTNLWTV